MGQVEWQEIGLNLCLSLPELKQIKQDYSSNEVRLGAVIDSWMLKAKNSTDAAAWILLSACDEAGVGGNSIMKKLFEF